MEPDAKRGRLLYLSDAGTNDVVVYRYPSLVEAGVLTGFDEPQGECVDKAGNVWITNSLVSNVLEYAHGGTTAIATLSDRGQYPVGCSVDEKSGTLAVSNIATRRKTAAAFRSTPTRLAPRRLSLRRISMKSTS